MGDSTDEYIQKILSDVFTPKYMDGWTKFFLDRKMYEKAIPSVIQLDRRQRLQFVTSKYEKILFDLKDRPKRVKMHCVDIVDELDVFCSAICIGWKLCPDYWLGLQLILDYLSEDTLPEDIVRININTLRILKEIALYTDWSSPMCGTLLSSQAKCIIVRRFKNSSLPNNLAFLLGNIPGIAPTPPQYCNINDSRRICNGIECYEVENYSVKFKTCGQCKSVFYCSKSCQVKAWKKDHKQNCAK